MGMIAGVERAGQSWADEGVETGEIRLESHSMATMATQRPRP